MLNFFAGEHGGNLDNHLHGPGSTVYLPVRQPGGMLAIGDMHACMGDGEVSGTGVEIEGDVVIRVGLHKGAQGTWPVTELADCWVTHGTTLGDLGGAIELACEEAARLLVDHWEFTPTTRSSSSRWPATSASRRPASRRRRAIARS